MRPSADASRPHVPRPTLRVLVADDQPLVRAGVAGVLGTAPDLEVVGEAGDGAAAVELCRALAPDVVVMDVRMPGTDGISATRAIVADAELAATRVLVLTTFETDDHVAAALRAGASGFIGKDTEPARLIDAVRTVAAGEALLSASATRGLIARYLAAPDPARPGEHVAPSPVDDAAAAAVLTAREREVVALVALGLDNSEIADRLVISPLTAKTHVTRAISKVGVRDRAQLVVWAYRSGLGRTDG